MEKPKYLRAIFIDALANEVNERYVPNNEEAFINLIENWMSGIIEFQDIDSNNKLLTGRDFKYIILGQDGKGVTSTKLDLSAIDIAVFDINKMSSIH